MSRVKKALFVFLEVLQELRYVSTIPYFKILLFYTLNREEVNRQIFLLKNPKTLAKDK